MTSIFFDHPDHKCFLAAVTVTLCRPGEMVASSMGIKADKIKNGKIEDHLIIMIGKNQTRRLFKHFNTKVSKIMIFLQETDSEIQKDVDMANKRNGALHVIHTGINLAEKVRDVLGSEIAEQHPFWKIANKYTDSTNSPIWNGMEEILREIHDYEFIKQFQMFLAVDLEKITKLGEAMLQTKNIWHGLKSIWEAYGYYSDSSESESE